MIKNKCKGKIRVMGSVKKNERNQKNNKKRKVCQYDE